METDMYQIFKLDNPIQNYAWGSRVAIAELLGDAVPSDRPQAEMWMGAHPKAPSMLKVKEHVVSLPDLIKENPDAILGVEAARKFNRRMPFLFKVLAAAEPLSIQAHPDREQARAGFDRENRQGVPLDAPRRNYRDASHKPEIICALTDFWGLNGFRPIATIDRNLRHYGPQTLMSMAGKLDAQDETRSLKIFFEELLRMSDSRRVDVIDDVIEQARRKASPDSVAEWVMRLHTAYPGDIGILAPLFLNLVCLAPGQAMYLSAGQLHAYLEGVGIELMANSDNVLRGGLTPKHVDVGELMQVLQFMAGEPQIITARPVGPVENIYDTPAEEFELARLSMNGDHEFTAASDRRIEILLMAEGAATIETTDGQVKYTLRKGDSVLIPACLPGYCIRGKGQFFRASVPSL